MIPRRRFNIEPWIEALVLNYGQQGKAKWLKCCVLKVAEMPESHPLMENGEALLFLSDKKVSIPAVLTKQAWEVMQEKEERDVVSDLKQCTVCLQVYNLEFRCEAELNKSRFIFTVEKMATVSFGATVDDLVPCCTSLPSVKEKVYETWRSGTLDLNMSLQGENSSATIDTQSMLSLSDLLTIWHEEDASGLLADLKTRLAPPSPPHPPSSSSPLPGPSSSRANPPPAARSTYLPTGWRADRGRYKGQEAYTFTVSHFYIPAEQLELMQSHPEGRGGELEPQDDNTSASPVHREGRALPDSGEDGSSPMASGEQEKRPANPWDIYALRVENLSMSSLEVSLSESPMHNPPLVGQSPSLLLPLDRDRAAVPTATSPRASPLERSGSWDLFSGSDQSSEDVPVTAEDQSEGPDPEPHPLEPRPLEPSHPNSDMQPSAGSSAPSLIREILTGSDNQTLPPYQKPRPRNASGCSPVRDGSFHYFLDPFASSTDNPVRPPVLTSSSGFYWDKPATPQQGPHAPPIREEEEGVVTGEPERARRKRRLAFTEADVAAAAINGLEERGERSDSRAGRTPKRKRSQTGSPPSWLYHTQAAGHREDRGPSEGGATGEEGGPTSAADIRSVITSHPDGTPFLHRYEPAPRAAEALSLYKVPDDLVRWSARYLFGPDGSKETS
ncbi:adrenocortical dysplasia protein homolog [Anguilla rostrata]|uniref:adrenocortical dysplasia protein homolog n=1 Tax=Anguilla rostrata TaxID=7938 RepID=UPI0030D23206